MDLQPKPDGHLHFKLGPVEKWLIAAGAAIVIGTPVMLYRDMKSESKAQRYILDRLVTESAVTNSRLDTMNAMLSDVPSLRRDVAELKVRVDRQEEEVRDLRARVR